MATCVRPIFGKPDEESLWRRHPFVIRKLSARFPEAQDMLAEARDDILALSSSPKEHRRRMWSNNPL